MGVLAPEISGRHVASRFVINNYVDDFSQGKSL